MENQSCERLKKIHHILAKDQEASINNKKFFNQNKEGNDNRRNKGRQRF